MLWALCHRLLKVRFKGEVMRELLESFLASWELIPCIIVKWISPLLVTDLYRSVKEDLSSTGCLINARTLKRWSQVRQGSFCSPHVILFSLFYPGLDLLLDYDALSQCIHSLFMNLCLCFPPYCELLGTDSWDSHRGSTLYASSIGLHRASPHKFLLKKNEANRFVIKENN